TTASTLVVRNNIPHTPGTWTLADQLLSGTTPYDITLPSNRPIQVDLQANEQFVFNAANPGTSSSLISTVVVAGNSTNTITINGTASDDVFEIDGNNVSVNGGPVITVPAGAALSINGQGGNNTIHVKNFSPANLKLSIDGGASGSNTLDLSGNNFSGGFPAS